VTAEPTFRFELEPHNCFVCGELNVHGLHLPIRARAGVVFADLVLAADYEGWQGIAHGGIIAALLDEVMEWALFETDAWGVTAEMQVRYRAPVPIGEPIHVEGRVTGGRRRLYDTASTIVDAAGNILAEASGRYLAATAAQREALERRYHFRMVPVAETSA
jgi:acyl-coenzyme A thioesterase PaaI-like protein